MSVNYKNQLIDNTTNYKLCEYLKDFLLDDTYNELYIATGYWDIPAIAVLYNELKIFLARDDTRIKLLLGEDPEVKNYQLLHADNIDLGDYPKSYFLYHLENIPVIPEYEASIKLLLENTSGDNPKFEIHVFDKYINQSFLHAKCYIFKGIDDSKAIVGSSNFTKNGLENNAELNYLEVNSANVLIQPREGTIQKGHLTWFYEQWDKSKSWEKIFIRVLANTKIGNRSFERIIEEDNKKVIKNIESIFTNPKEEDGDMNVPRIPEWLNLFEYQKEAIEVWKENNYRGIFDMATGTGKTLTGLSAMAVLSESVNDKLAVFIVCPYQHLVEQWVEDIMKFGIKPIIGYSESIQKNWKSQLKNAVIDQPLVKGKEFFCFISTNATFSSDYVQSQIRALKLPALLLVDEAHNFGASYLRKLLSDKFKYRLALSATLNRHGDAEGTSALYNYFGTKCIEYDLSRAIKEDKLTPYNYYPVIVNLTELELDKYQELTKQLSKCLIKASSAKLKLNKRGKILALERSRLVAGAVEKISALEREIRKYIDDRHILVYCGATRIFDEDYCGLTEQENNDDVNEGKRQIEIITDILGNKLDMKVSQFTSKEDIEERSVLLKEFSKGENLKVLIAIKCLDEGVNIPEIKTAFILASTTNPKEYIQRRGRVLRKSSGKIFANIYDFITLPRPLNDVYGLTEESKKQDKGLIRNELIRAYEFANIAANKMDIINILDEIKQLYNLEDKDLVMNEEIQYE